MSFIEENCIVFDNEEENRLEYTEIHQQFQKIVDELLCELMAELELSQEQFMSSCEKATNPAHQRIVNQILAVDNFVQFKKLMIKRNSEMNEEALKWMMKKEQQQV